MDSRWTPPGPIAPNRNGARAAWQIWNTRPDLREPAASCLRSQPPRHRHHPVEHPIPRACSRHPAPDGKRPRSSAGAHLSAGLGTHQPDRRLRLGRPERRVGKLRRIEAPPHPARGIQESRMMFMFRPAMRNQEASWLVPAKRRRARHDLSAMGCGVAGFLTCHDKS